MPKQKLLSKFETASGNSIYYTEPDPASQLPARGRKVPDTSLPFKSPSAVESSASSDVLDPEYARVLKECDRMEKRSLLSQLSYTNRKRRFIDKQQQSDPELAVTLEEFLALEVEWSDDEEEQPCNDMDLTAEEIAALDEDWELDEEQNVDKVELTSEVLADLNDEWVDDDEARMPPPPAIVSDHAGAGLPPTSCKTSPRTYCKAPAATTTQPYAVFPTTLVNEPSSEWDNWEKQNSHEYAIRGAFSSTRTRNNYVVHYMKKFSLEPRKEKWTVMDQQAVVEGFVGPRDEGVVPFEYETESLSKEPTKGEKALQQLVNKFWANRRWSEAGHGVTKVMLHLEIELEHVERLYQLGLLYVKTMRCTRRYDATARRRVIDSVNRRMENYMRMKFKLLSCAALASCAASQRAVVKRENRPIDSIDGPPSPVKVKKRKHLASGWAKPSDLIGKGKATKAIKAKRSAASSSTNANGQGASRSTVTSTVTSTTTSATSSSTIRASPLREGPTWSMSKFYRPLEDHPAWEK